MSAKSRAGLNLFLGVLLCGRLAAAEDACERVERSLSTQWPSSRASLILEIADDPSLWEVNFQKSSNSTAFGAWVSAHVNPDPIDILIKNRDLYVNAAAGFDASAFDLILSKKAGEIRPINCLESKLFDFSCRTFPFSVRPAEFGAVVLISSSTKSLKVYFVQGDEMTVPMSDIYSLLTTDLEQGWRLHKDIHRHPFWFTKGNMLSGALRPSPGDQAHYKRIKNLPEAAIINGISTLVLKKEEFFLFP